MSVNRLKAFRSEAHAGLQSENIHSEWKLGAMNQQHSTTSKTSKTIVYHNYLSKQRSNICN
jgi:hypothetical protein